MWTYHGKMSPRDIDLHFLKQEFGDICALYIMGDKFQMTELKNTTINAFYAHQLRTETIPDTSVVRVLWENTYEKDCMRNLCVALFALRAENDYFSPSLIDLLPTEFVSRVLQRALRARYIGFKRKGDWTQLETCKYHDHPDKVYCENNVDPDDVPKLFAGGRSTQ